MLQVAAVLQDVCHLETPRSFNLISYLHLFCLSSLCAHQCSPHHSWSALAHFHV